MILSEWSAFEFFSHNKMHHCGSPQQTCICCWLHNHHAVGVRLYLKKCFHHNLPLWLVWHSSSCHSLNWPMLNVLFLKWTQPGKIHLCTLGIMHSTRPPILRALVQEVPPHLILHFQSSSHHKISHRYGPSCLETQISKHLRVPLQIWRWSLFLMEIPIWLKVVWFVAHTRIKWLLWVLFGLNSFWTDNEQLVWNNIAIGTTQEKRIRLDIVFVMYLWDNI